MMTFDTNTLIAYYCAIAAVYNVVLQGFDLHTTSEALKNKTGTEANPVLAWWLNSDASHAKKFWALAVIKLITAAACGAIGFAGWSAPALTVAAAIFLTLLGGFYTKVILDNLKIYKGA